MPEKQTEHDLNLLNSRDNRIISQDEVSSFIELKNLLSLYGRNKKSFVDKLSQNIHIIENFIKNSRIGGIDIYGKNEEIASQFYDAIVKDNPLVMIAEKYNDEIHKPYEKQNDDVTLHETNGNVQLRLAYKVVLNDGSYGYITIAVLPKLETILDKNKANFGGTDTGTSYKNKLEEYNSYLTKNNKNFLVINVTDSTPKTTLGINDGVFDIYTGIRTGALTDNPIDANTLKNQGIRINPEVRIFPKNIDDIITIFTEYGLN